MTHIREFLVRYALDVALIVLLVAVVTVEEVYQPRMEVPVLYVLPVAVAALRWNVRPVMVVVSAVAAVAFFDLVRRVSASFQWNGYFWGLMIVAFIALVLTRQRERARQEAIRRQQVIHDVERLRQPITVILGYAQYILNRSDAATTTCQRAASTIAREADKVRYMLSDIIAERAPPDH
jgi:signal transduction histidine kinase